MKIADRILGVCAIILGVAIFAIGNNSGLRFYAGSTPGPGFMPSIMAVCIAFFGLIVFLGTFRPEKQDAVEDNELLAALQENEEAENPEKAPDAVMIGIFERDELKNLFSVTIISILVVLTAKLLGLVTAMGIGVGALAKLLGTPKWRTSILLTICCTLIFHFVFDRFLGVPVPKGPFGF